jgi:DNA (cytosine-5)-methyltransferase 1
MRHGSLFSGIGGFDLAAQWMGWENIFHCEWNEFGQKALKYYWPEAISYNDITKTDFTIHRGSIDILTGGFPCQPYSLAGKRKGKEDERHLWPEIQPRWVVGENVFGLINWSGGLVFHEVQTDLEAEGYEVFPYVLPAVSVNAPHRRDRVWFVAYAKNQRHSQCSHGTYERWDTARCKEGESSGSCANAPYTSGDRLEGRGDDRICEQEKFSKPEGLGTTLLTSDPDSRRQPGEEYREAEPGWITKKSLSTKWENWPTQSPLCSGSDGIPAGLAGITVSKYKQESIKGYGNAVVPQVVYQIFKTIEEYDT